MAETQDVRMRQKKARLIFQAIAKDWRLYVLLLPMVIWFAIWMYKPMGGLLIAFKRFDPSLGVLLSEFKGIDNFINMINGVVKEEFWQAFRNTFIISSYSLVFGFPVPIILALLFSELNHEGIRKITQTITYLPHFLSEVTITGIVLMLVYNGVHSAGVITTLFINQGWIEPNASIIQQANYFRPLYIITGIWKESGYNSIVYYAAIMGISPALYEALKVDGGNKFQEIRYVTIPCMAPTLIIMVIMRIGRMLSIGYERVLLLYNTNIYVTADVLSTFEQRIGIISGNYGIGSASSLFNSLIAFALVIGANTISRNISKTSLW
jgi:putative aldouronate transport system permease protein